MANHQSPIHALRESTERLGLSQGERKRLLDKDVFARLDSATRELRMQNSRCRDRHTGDISITQNRLEFDDRRMITTGELVRRGLVGIADCRECTKLGEITNQILAPIPAANDSHPHRTLRFSARAHDFAIVQKRSSHATAVRVTGVPPERTAKGRCREYPRGPVVQAATT